MQRRWLADLRRLAGAAGSGLVRGFLRGERGTVSPLFALLLIPICGLLAVAVEVGDAGMLQRGEQHAADSAALAAATGNDTKTYSGAAGYVLEAKAVATKYPIGNATVATIQTDCPGSASGANDCYKVTINRTVPLYLGQVIGVTSMSPTAIAYARWGSIVDLCLVSLGSGGITTDGNSTGFNLCYAEALQGTVKCTSVVFEGVFAPATQACSGSPVTTIPSSTTNPYPSKSSSIPTQAQVPCSANVNSLTSWTTVGDTQYARLCSTSTLQMTANVSLSSGSSNKALILDNATIDTNGHNFSATSTNASNGFTVISTNSSGGNLADWFVNSANGAGSASTVTVQGPIDSTGTFADFSFLDNDGASITSATAFAPPSNHAVNLNVTGVIYAPLRDLTFNGVVNSSIGGITCISIVAKSITSNGGKLQNNPVSGCTSAGYKTLTQTVTSVALVK